MLTVQPSLLSQKPDLPFSVASDKSHDDCFLLTALEPIYTAQFDARECLFEGREYRKLASLSVICAA